MASTDGTIIDTEAVKHVYPMRWFYSKVAGDSHLNPDGSSRQYFISQCQANQAFMLRPEPHNRYSKHAIAVHLQSGQQLGYLPDETAAKLMDDIKAGRPVLCLVSEITGGDAQAGKSYYGMNLLLVLGEDPETRRNGSMPSCVMSWAGRWTIPLPGQLLAKVDDPSSNRKPTPWVMCKIIRKKRGEALGEGEREQ